MAMTYEEATSRVHGLLSDLAPDLTVDSDEYPDALASPVLSEWVLILNVVDFDSSETRLAIVASPTMLRSHVVGLLAVARECA